MKRIIAIMLTFILAFSLAACGSGASNEDNEGKKPVVYTIGDMTGGAAWGPYEEGFMKACEELGFEGYYLAPVGGNYVAEMINLTETAITNGCDGLIPQIVDEEAMADLIQRGLDEGITMVALYMECEQLDTTIGTDSEKLGIAMAETLVECMGDRPIYCASIQSQMTYYIQEVQVDAFEKRLHELRPDAVVVRKDECLSNAQIAMDKLAAICTAYPETNCSVSFDSYAGIGAATYVESEGLQDEFCVIGIDDSEDILLCVKNNTMKATVAQNWYDMGYDSVYLLAEKMAGNDVSGFHDSGTTPVFQDTVDDYASSKGYEW